ncbi:MAG: PQQ-binding-like beta-propeller repeat protein [Verrucomicrobiales bacterium]
MQTERRQGLEVKGFISSFWFILPAALLLLGVNQVVQAEDWPRWRGPALNGISTETEWTHQWPNETPKQLWKAKVGIGFSSMALSKGKVYTMGNKDEIDTVYCLDAETGKEVWKQSYPCPLDATYYEGGPGSTPTVDGDKVYTLSKRGHLYCFQAADGKIIWQKDLIKEQGIAKPRWGFAGSPLVVGSRLLVNVGKQGTCLEKSTGKILWGGDKGLTGYSTPIPLVANGKTNILIFSAKALIAVALADGEKLWEFPWETGWDINAADPIVIGSKVFLSSFDRGCALIETAFGKGEVLWENQEMGNHFNSCIVIGNAIYGMNGNSDKPQRDFRSLDLQTGKVNWKQEGFGLGSLMAADHKLIILSDKGELVIAKASPEAFTELARSQVLGGKCWTVPVLANGRIYCRNAEGTLVCIDVKKESGNKSK